MLREAFFLIKLPQLSVVCGAEVGKVATLTLDPKEKAFDLLFEYDEI